MPFFSAAQDSDTSDDDGGDNDDGPAEDSVATVAPVRNHYLIRSHRRRDRLVKTLDEALDIDNYDMLPAVSDGEEIRYEIPMTADKAWDTKARTLRYTNKPPTRHRQPAENITVKARSISEEAKAAATPKQLWQLFFTDRMLDMIVKYTNEKIMEDLAKSEYSRERLQQSPYLKPIDRVRNLQISVFLFHT